MSGIIILLIALVALVCGYVFYGRWLAKQWGVDNSRVTPAVEYNDGVDYVPTKAQVVFGHQFASIAGAGPINGPIQAAIFGWVPVLLWCVIGGIFFGAVQDFSAMFASVRNKGRSIGIIIENYVGKLGKRLFLIFVYLFCILVIAAFADIVAKSFGVTDAATAAINKSHGQVATTSVLFIFFAVAFGFFLKYVDIYKIFGPKGGTAVNTGIAIVVLIVAIAIGLAFPMTITVKTWSLLVFAYILVACVAPVWALLQPRDYLNSYLLVAMIAAAVIGIFASNPEVKLNAFNGFKLANGTSIFPFLFVTIACGAVSGFHSLVSSDTASKQVSRESDMLPISYGAMLVESLLGIISLVAVCAIAVDGAVPAGTPQDLFASAVAGFLGPLGVSPDLAFTLISLSVSAFALTSLDSVARVGRLTWQELFLDAEDDHSGKELPGWKKILTNSWVATIIVLAPSYALMKVGYAKIWPLFGSANQLLAVLALAAVAVFLKKIKKNNKMMILPMFFMLAVTGVALIQIIIKQAKTIIAPTAMSDNLAAGLQLVFAILLLALAVIVVVQCCQKLFGKDEE
ncbi:MAG: carbon starvation protein A [Spirochaetales bacterium]|nr:carbon starvation protein A [Spirochaetales bacterium]